MNETRSFEDFFLLLLERNDLVLIDLVQLWMNWDQEYNPIDKTQNFFNSEFYIDLLYN